MPSNGFLEASSATASSAHRGGNYAALDGLRGFAVLLVFCVHAASNAAYAFLDPNFSTFRSLSSNGERLLFWIYRSHHGVLLFFVLSGFLIGRMWWPKAVMPYPIFAWRRMLRIYPAFLVAFAVSLVFSYTSGDWHLPDWPRVVGNQPCHLVTVLRDGVLSHISVARYLRTTLQSRESALVATSRHRITCACSDRGRGSSSLMLVAAILRRRRRHE
jgi:peptidoglycan/LPS O-acetylase OafA/YrhL